METSRSAWMPVESAPRNGESGKLLVTNNLYSRDAHGNMSHLWLVGTVHKEKGGFIAFDHGIKVENLTHWCKPPSNDTEAPRRAFGVGDYVTIADYSEAHGEKGRINHIQSNGIIHVEMEGGCVWPVTADCIY